VARSEECDDVTMEPQTVVEEFRVPLGRMVGPLDRLAVSMWPGNGTGSLGGCA